MLFVYLPYRARKYKPQMITPAHLNQIIFFIFKGIGRNLYLSGMIHFNYAKSITADT